MIHSNEFDPIRIYGSLPCGDLPLSLIEEQTSSGLATRDLFHDLVEDEGQYVHLFDPPVLLRLIVFLALVLMDRFASSIQIIIFLRQASLKLH